MKRILAMLLLCALALSFCACEKNENTIPSYSKLATLSESVVDEIPPETASAQNIKAEYVGDTHEWAEGNLLYNINDYYEPTDRYYMTFKRTGQSAALWHGTGSATAPDEKYDPDKAVAFAKAHWNDGEELCAPFVSRCLKAGELSFGSDSSTALCFKLLKSGLGFGQFVPMNKDGSITLPEYAKKGDIVQLYCSYEGLMIHSMMVVGFDGSGRIKVCAHNPEDSGQDAFGYEEPCNSCLTPLREAFFFHFFGEGEKNLEPLVEYNNTLLFEKTGYVIPNQRYDREKAVNSVKDAPIDGVGMFGAKQTSAALTAGGLNVGTPIQTALFTRLIKSRLGEMYNVTINPDRTVTLPDFVREGDVCFLLCPEEELIYSSFIVKGADADGKMLGYTRDKINNENSAFKVESLCPSSFCDAEITEVAVYHFYE